MHFLKALAKPAETESDNVEKQKIGMAPKVFAIVVLLIAALGPWNPVVNSFIPKPMPVDIPYKFEPIEGSILSSVNIREIEGIKRYELGYRNLGVKEDVHAELTERIVPKDFHRYSSSTGSLLDYRSELTHHYADYKGQDVITIKVKRTNNFFYRLISDYDYFIGITVH